MVTTAYRVVQHRLFAFDHNDEEVVTIHVDGTVTLAPHVEADEAARAFWRCFAANLMPQASTVASLARTIERTAALIAAARAAERIDASLAKVLEDALGGDVLYLFLDMHDRPMLAEDGVPREEIADAH